MALFHVNFFSDVLGFSTGMDVILPQRARGQIGMNSSEIRGEKLPTLYLLHGLSDDQTIWQRRTSIERYAADYRVAVVMPTVFRGFYADMKYGYKYWTFVSEELPELCRDFFPLSDKREDNFAAGLSMGGFGALKLGLNCPDKYAAVASLSGAVDMVTHSDRWEGEFGAEMRMIFGTVEELRGSADDLIYMAKKAITDGTQLPKIHICCGTEDFLIEDNRRMYDVLKGKCDLTYFEEPGVHEWGFWDRNIQKVLEWLPIGK